MAKKPEKPSKPKSKAAPPAPDGTPADVPRPASRRAVEPHVVRYGNVDPASTLLDRLEFDVQQDALALGWVSEALRNAAAHRLGYPVIGKKGSGKSMALEEAARAFAAREETLKQNDNSHVPRKVRAFGPVKAANRSEFIRWMYVAEMGGIPVRSARAGDPGLLAELIEMWLDENVSVVAFEEGEGLAAGALEVCRDIIAQSDSEAGKTSASGRFSAKGIGVVIVGTSDVLDLLRRQPDYGERWAGEYFVDSLTAEGLPEVYRRYLPAFEAEAIRMGPGEWAHMIKHDVAPTIGGSLRRVEIHVRHYIGMCSDQLDPPPAELSDVPYEEALFFDALNTLPRREPSA